AGSANIGRSEEPRLSAGGTSAADVSPYGVFDMAGHAGRWVDGTFSPYQGNQVPNPDYGKAHIVLGPSHHSPLNDARATFRGNRPSPRPGGGARRRARRLTSTAKNSRRF